MRPRTTLPLVLIAVLSSCFATREYPEEWSILDEGRRDLTGFYENRGLSNGDHILLGPAQLHLTNLVLEASGDLPEEADALQVQLVDHGEEIEVLVWEGEEVVARRRLAMGSDHTPNYGLYWKTVAWDCDERVERQDRDVLFTFILNGYEGRRLRFHRAVDGSLVMKTKVFTTGLVLYIPFWISGGTHWTRWESIEQGSARAAVAAN